MQSFGTPRHIRLYDWKIQQSFFKGLQLFWILNSRENIKHCLLEVLTKIKIIIG